MIGKCLNPDCDAQMREVGLGEIYSLERRLALPSRRVEFFWLCPACLPEHAVTLTEGGSICVVDRSPNHRLPPPNPAADLRVAFSMKKRPVSNRKPVAA